MKGRGTAGSFLAWPGWAHLRYVGLLSLSNTLWFLAVYGGADFLTQLNPDSLTVVPAALLEPSLASAAPGSRWQFERKGVINVPRSADEDEVMMAALDAGAEDIVDEGDTWRVVTPPTDLHRVEAALADAGLGVESTDLTMVPTATVALGDADSAKKVLRVVDALDEHDDVQNVYANFDIPDDVLQAVTADV